MVPFAHDQSALDDKLGSSNSVERIFASDSPSPFKPFDGRLTTKTYSSKLKNVKRQLICDSSTDAATVVVGQSDAKTWQSPVAQVCYYKPYSNLKKSDENFFWIVKHSGIQTGIDVQMNLRIGQKTAML